MRRNQPLKATGGIYIVFLSLPIMKETHLQISNVGEFPDSIDIFKMPDTYI